MHLVTRTPESGLHIDPDKLGSWIQLYTKISNQCLGFNLRMAAQAPGSVRNLSLILLYT
jgi:hypothetical protein